MSAEIIPFDFEEQAVRVVMRGEEPWFVAADVCRVLEIANRHDALSRLDEDERDAVGSTDSIGRSQQMSIINESGLYALVLTSRKEQARRFRKWITAEVLPAIRRHGRYEHPGVPASEGGGDVFGLTYREAELLLSMVREARLTRGTRAAITLWDRSALPRIGASALVDAATAQACLAHLAGQAGDPLRSAMKGCDIAAADLARKGLRWIGHGLFVRNGDLLLFDGTPWAGGAHRDALLALPGVVTDGPRTLAGQGARGIVVPAHYFERGDAS